MRNRLPTILRIVKRSRDYKEMNRGDYKTHRYTYVMEDKNVIRSYGLVCWKDSDIVYALTNNGDKTKTCPFYRRTGEGSICIDRPNIISDYNEFMGGVDLADMRRLHCNSTIMGLHRWWLKLFFYLLDMGTSNALVIHRLSQSGLGSEHNIVEFKKALVLTLVGDKIQGVPEQIVEHQLVRMQNNQRLGCAYCSLLCR